MLDRYPAGLPRQAYTITIQHNQAEVTATGSGISFVRTQVAKVMKIGYGVKHAETAKVLESWKWYVARQGKQVFLPIIPGIYDGETSAKIISVSALTQSSITQSSFSVQIEVYG